MYNLCCFVWCACFVSTWFIKSNGGRKQWKHISLYNYLIPCWNYVYGLKIYLDLQSRNEHCTFFFSLSLFLKDLYLCLSILLHFFFFLPHLLFIKRNSHFELYISSNILPLSSIKILFYLLLSLELTITLIKLPSSFRIIIINKESIMGKKVYGMPLASHVPWLSKLSCL